MTTTSKPFRDLTLSEAQEIAREIVRSSKSEAEIRERLTKAGFNGEAAYVCSISSGGMFCAMAMIYGPGNEIISV